MLRFEHPSYFWLLILLPALILFYTLYLAWQRKKIKQIGRPAVIHQLFKGKINGRSTTKVVLWLSAMLCVILALAHLQGGGKAVETNRKGVELMFVLDVSKSMLATDISPNRLTRAQQFITRTLNDLKNNRAGLIVFAGDAYLQVPLTVDFNALQMILSSVSPDMVPTQGTNIGSAISMATSAFDHQDQKHKAIILISDGEDHDDQALSATKDAHKSGIVVYTLGIGSPEGSTIYDPSTGQPKVDRKGQPIITRLNEQMLQDIAKAGDGLYQHLQQNNATSKKLSQSIMALGTKDLGKITYTDYKSYYQYFLALALLLLVAAWLLPNARKNQVSPGNPQAGIKASTPSILLLLSLSFLLLTPGTTMGQNKATAKNGSEEKPLSTQYKRSINQANKAFLKQHYDDAEEQYRKGLSENNKNFEGLFNLGDALYQKGGFQEAQNQFQQSLQHAKTKEQKADGYHNLGNTFMKQKQWEKAIEAYKQSLLNRPNDLETKYNLAYAQKHLQQQNKNNKDKDNKQNKNNQDNKDNKEDNKDNKNNQDNQDQQKEKQKQQDQTKDQNQQDKENAKGQHPDPKTNEKKEERQSPGQPSKLSKQQADNILDALNQEEKQLHKRKKGKGRQVQPEKDW